MKLEKDENHTTKPVPTKNKRVLGPWVAHLKITVYEGIGKHSSTLSATMNFDRSAVSLRKVSIKGDGNHDDYYVSNERS